MTDQTKTGPTKSKAKDPIQVEFEALPLEQKFANLLRMEAVTISEAVTYVVNSSMKAFEKAGEAIEDFGTKVEKEARKAAESAKSASGAGTPKSGAAKPKSRSTKRPPNPRSTK